jgi:hypothetical protein
MRDCIIAHDYRRVLALAVSIAAAMSSGSRTSRISTSIFKDWAATFSSRHWGKATGFAMSWTYATRLRPGASSAKSSRRFAVNSSVLTACALGAASSFCSYAAVALARSVFRKGADFTAAMAFELASTNLVLELSIIILVLLGWQFMLAEAIGAPIMVILIAIIFRRFLSRDLVGEAKVEADKGVAGRMEGHAEMDMAVTEGSLW